MSIEFPATNKAEQVKLNEMGFQERNRAILEILKDEIIKNNSKEVYNRMKFLIDKNDNGFEDIKGRNCAWAVKYILGYTDFDNSSTSSIENGEQGLQKEIGKENFTIILKDKDIKDVHFLDKLLNNSKINVLKVGGDRGGT